MSYFTKALQSFKKIVCLNTLAYYALLYTKGSFTVFILVHKIIFPTNTLAYYVVARRRRRRKSFTTSEPEAAADRHDDEGHEGDDEGAEVEVRVGEIRLLGVRLCFGRIVVARFDVFPVKNCSL